MRVRGSGFAPDSQITVGGGASVNDIVVVSGEELHVMVALPADAPAGPVELAVQNSDGTNATAPLPLYVIPLGDLPPEGQPDLNGANPAVIHLDDPTLGRSFVELHGFNLVEPDPRLLVEIDDGSPAGITQFLPPRVTDRGLLIRPAATDAAAVGLHDVSVIDPTSGRSDTLEDAFVVRRFGGEFLGLSPHRTIDTRDGTGLPSGKLPADSVTTVPANVLPLTRALSVTITEPTGPGYLTVYEAGTAAPSTSNLNFEAGQTVSNTVIVHNALGTGAGVSFHLVGASAHLVVDTLGMFTDGPTAKGQLDIGGVFIPMTPTRLLDSRATGAPLGPAETVKVRVGDSGAHLRAALVNITVVNPTEATYITAYSSELPYGHTEPRPLISNVNAAARQTVSNVAIRDSWHRRDDHLVQLRWDDGCRGRPARRL